MHKKWRSLKRPKDMIKNRQHRKRWCSLALCASLRCQTPRRTNSTLRASTRRLPSHQNWPVYDEKYCMIDLPAMEVETCGSQMTFCNVALEAYPTE